MANESGTGAAGHYICIIKRDQSYLVPMEQIERIQAETEIIPVPGAPASILGVIWYEGGLVPAAHLEAWEKPGTVRCCAILRAGNGRLFCMAADNVGEITDADKEQFEGQEEFLRLLSGGI